MLLLLLLVSSAVVAHSFKLPFKNVHPRTFLPPSNEIKENRIWHGRNANYTTAPFQVHFNVFGQFYCGGAILSESWVATAAHCVSNKNDIAHPGLVEVTAGGLILEEDEGTEQVRRIDRLYVNKFWDQARVTYDVALVHLETPFILNDKIQAIKFADKRPDPGDRIVIAGFGANHNGKEPGKLKWLTQEVISNEQCQYVFTSCCARPDRPIDIIDDVMSCMGDSNMTALPLYYRTGAGDSGGPVFQYIDGTPYLVAIVSWGNDIAYDVNANVLFFRDWIEEHMENSTYTFLEVTSTEQHYSWHSTMLMWNTQYIKLSCHTPDCRIHVKNVKVQNHSDDKKANFDVSLFSGWGFSQGDDRKTPIGRFNVTTYDSKYADMGYVSDGDKMVISILLGGWNMDYKLSYTYVIYDSTPYQNCKAEAKLCDEINDCMDLTDELDCEYNKTGNNKPEHEYAAGCYTDDFMCKDEITCIRKHKKCDDWLDCNGNFDEKRHRCVGAGSIVTAQFHVILSACILSLIFSF